MNVLMISTDRSVFQRDSAIRGRLKEQSKLVEELHVVVLAAKGMGAKEERVTAHLVIHSTESHNRFTYMTDALGLGRRIIEQEKTAQWVITAQDPFWTGATGYIIARKCKIPFHLQLHTDIFSAEWRGSVLPRLLRPWTYLRDMNELRYVAERLFSPGALFLLKHADGVRVISERLRRRVEMLGVSPGKITKVPIYTDTKELMREGPSFDLHETYREYQSIVLSMGRLEPEKNFHGLVRAFGKVHKHFPDALLVIVGSGSERERLLRLARSLELEKHVKFLPWARDIVSYYKSCDVYVQPSLFEGWGLSVIEALAAGAPVVMSDVGCAGEIVIHEESGLVVPPGDETALADALVRMLNDEQLREKVIINGKKALTALPSKAATLRLYKESWMKAVRSM